MVGYSGTPLVQKLGIKGGMKGAVVGAPADYRRLVTGLPADVSLVERGDATLDFIHVFVTERRVLEREIPRVKKLMKPEGMIWVSWPKRASKVQTDVTEDVVRELALRAGLVDVKVCAIDEVWSGLKLVIRAADRGKLRKAGSR